MRIKSNTHKIIREYDEYVCSCGLRWDYDEPDPHHKTPEENVADMREKLKHNKG